MVFLPHHQCLSPLVLCPLSLSPLCFCLLGTLPQVKFLLPVSSGDFGTLFNTGSSSSLSEFFESVLTSSVDFGAF